MSKQILKVGANIGTFGLAGLVGSALSKKKKAPEAEPAPAPVMPTPDDEAIHRARKRSIVQQMGRRGRESTYLSGSRLGG